MTSRQNKARSKKKTTADAAVFVVMRRAQQCRPRRQSVAVLPSLAPHGVAKPRTPHPIPQAAQLFKCRSANVRGRGARPLVFLSGVQGGYSLSRKRVSPFIRAALSAAIPTALCAESKKRGPRFRAALFLCRFSSRSRYCSHSHCCSRSHRRSRRRRRSG